MCVCPTKMRASLSLVRGSIFLSSFFVSFSAMEKERRKKEKASPLANLVARQRRFLRNDSSSFYIFLKIIPSYDDKTKHFNDY